MNSPVAYWSDGSYTYSNNPSVNYKVYYSTSGNEHSAIIYSRIPGPIGPNAYGTITVTSKWGQMGLIRHGAMYCPYYTSGLTLNFYY